MASLNHKLRSSIMKRSLLSLLTGALLLTQACQKQTDHAAAPTIVKAPDPTSLDAFIQKELLENGEFKWSWASDEQTWTALSNSDHVMAIGYQPAGAIDVQEHLNQININAPQWVAAREAVLNLVLEQERVTTPGIKAEDLIVWHQPILPALTVRVHNPNTISVLRKSALVRYAEPMGYEPFMTVPSERSSSGCGSNTATSGLVAGVDYNNITPNTKQSWNHSFHNINSAWANSNGSGTKVMIVDTGASFEQDNLDPEGGFNQGDSQGRSINREVTLPQNTNIFGQLTGSPETPDDACGHGTSMAGACAAPRGTDGAATGIAYNCDLVTVRAAADVFLNESREVQGVAAAFTMAGSDPSVRIVSMSMGRLTSASLITDAIKYAHQQGKLIFCAAGTSFSWTAWFTGVIYPASMTEAVAVTGIRDNLTTKCGACHQGSKVDFVVVMEKASNGRHPLSLDMDSDSPSTVGGSSVATASTAGIAALVWSKYPGWTRTQVFDRLKTSSNYFPSRNSNFGWGRINAQLATQ
jgi:Subtilase family